MNFTKYVTYVLPGLLLSAGLSMPGKVLATGDGSSSVPPSPVAQPGALYLPSDNPLADLAATLDTARESDKLALVILGGNWCHDSRALASRLYEEPLSTTINEHYETLFVDVGYLQKGKEVITSLGIPVYYATPTLLIVDPVTGRVVNAQNRHQWSDAASISMAESVDYFRLFANTDLTIEQGEYETDVDLQQLLNQIDAFEQTQAERLYQAYEVLAPMLRAYKEGDKDAFSEDLWNEVRDFRYQVPVDLERLRSEARQRVAAGETGIKLIYPVYPAFSWDPS